MAVTQEFLEGLRDRWPFAVPVGMSIGIGLYFALPSEPAWYIGPLGFVALVLPLVVGCYGRPELRMLLLGLCFIALGFTAASIRTLTIEGRHLSKETAFVGIEGRVLDVQPFDRGLRLILDHVMISTLRVHETPMRVRLRVRGTQPPIAPGNWIAIRGQLSPPSPPVQPGGFDFQRHAFFQGIGAVGFSVGPAKILNGPEPGPFDWRIHLANIRLAVADRVRQVIPGDGGTVAAALLTGHRTLIPERVLSDFRRAGLAHLLAISGLHIGLAAGIVFFGLRGLFVVAPALAMRLPVKKIAAITALVVAGAYALLAGATVPTQRAFFIAGLVLVAVIVDRRGISLRLLAWGAAVILLLQPESLLGPSFQMSFAAAIALVSAYEYVTEKGKSKQRVTRDRWFGGIAVYAGGVAFTTLVASLATAPFVVFHFNEVAKFGLLANMVAVPATALWVMPAAMMSFLLMPIGGEAIALTIMGWGVDVVLGVAAWVSALPDATEIFPSAPTWAVIILALGGLWVCLARGMARAAGLLGVGIWALSIAFVRPPDVLVSEDGKLAAVLDEGRGYRFSTVRSGRFTREGWLAHAGFSADARETWPENQPANAALSCDGQGCIVRKRGVTLSLSFSSHGLAEDCGQVSIAVTLVPASGLCPKTVPIIDIFDLHRRGTHAIWLGPKIRVEAVNDTRGKRPWVVRPSRKPNT